MSDIVIRAVVSPSPVIKPSNAVGLQGPRGWEVQLEYSVDGESWHTTPTSNDYYVRFSTDEGTTWGTAWYIRGEQGEGTGDMLAATYDPTSVGGDAFDCDNHASGTTNKVFSATEQSKLSGIAENANNYTLPTASDSTLGGVKVGSRLTITEGVLSADVQTKTRWLSLVIDGGGSAITTGIKADVVMPACTITEVQLLADQSGSIVVDLWKDTYANFPPTDADTITSSTPPTITTATKSTDSTLTSWTTSVSDGDILRVNVDSCTTIERCTLSIKISC